MFALKNPKDVQSSRGAMTGSLSLNARVILFAPNEGWLLAETSKCSLRGTAPAFLGILHDKKLPVTIAMSKRFSNLNSFARS